MIREVRLYLDDFLLLGKNKKNIQSYFFHKLNLIYI